MTDRRIDSLTHNLLKMIEMCGKERREKEKLEAQVRRLKAKLRAKK